MTAVSDDYCNKSKDSVEITGNETTFSQCVVEQFDLTNES